MANDEIIRELKIKFNESYKSGKIKEAIDCLNNIIRLEPNCAINYYNRGTLYANIGQNENAIEDYSKAIDLDTNYAEAYYNRGVLYANIGRNENAIEDYSKAIDLDTNYAKAYYNRGVLYANIGQNEAALEDFSKAIDINPEFSEAYYNRGLLYDMMRENEKALKDYTEAINKNSNFEAAYNNRGVLYANIGKHEAALEDYSKLINLNPNSVATYNNRGVLYSKIGKYEAAREDFSKAIDINPDNAEAYYNRGILYAMIGEDKSAIEDFNEVIRINPDNAEAYNNRGILYTKVEKHNAAEEDFSKAIKRNPKNAEAYNNEGNTCADNGKYGEALKCYNEAISLNPEDMKAYYNIGVLLHKLKDAKDANDEDGLKKVLKYYVDKEIYKRYINLKILDIAILEIVKDIIIDDTYKNLQKAYVEYNSKFLYDKIDKLEEKYKQNLIELYIKAERILDCTKYKIEKGESKFLAHYTSKDTTMKILEKDGKLRVNNAIHANDPEEGKVFRYLLEEKLQEEKNESGRIKFKKSNVYFTCFSENVDEYDSLPMWVNYADDTKGCALIFDNKFFKINENEDSLLYEGSTQINEKSLLYKGSTQINEDSLLYEDSTQVNEKSLLYEGSTQINEDSLLYEGSTQILDRGSKINKNKNENIPSYETASKNSGDRDSRRKSDLSYVELYKVVYLEKNKKGKYKINSRKYKKLNSQVVKFKGILKNINKTLSKECSEERKSQVKKILNNIIEYTSFIFKDKQFAYEKEVRIIKIGPFNSDDENKDSSRIYDELEREIKCKEIILGAKLEDKEAAANKLLNTEKVDEVTLSKLKYK